MEEDNFYIHLSSNVDRVSPLQVGNSIGNFVTHLSRKLNLSDDWEIGLTDISYTKTWYNIMNDEYITMQFSDAKFKKKEYVFLALKAGNYDTPESICKNINQVLEYNLNFFINELEIESFPRLEYHKESNRIKMIFGTQQDDNFYYMHFSNFLASMLGFLDSQGRQYPIYPPEPDHPWYTVKTMHISYNRPNLIAEALIKGTEKAELPVFIQKNEKPPEDLIGPSQESVNSQVKPNQTIDPTISKPSNPDPITQTPTISRPSNPNPNAQSSPILKPHSDTTPKPTLKPAPPKASRAQTSGGIESDSDRIQRGRPNNTVEDIDRKNRSNKPRDYDLFPDGNSRSKRSIDQPEIVHKRVKREVTQLVLSSFNEVTLNAGINSLYVYCNIIKPTLVGNVEAPLIRRVEIPSDKHFGDTVHIIYTSPQYYSFVSDEVSYIEIDVKDDSNQTIKFNSGRTGFTFHVRKKAKNVFESIYKLLR